MDILEDQLSNDQLMDRLSGQLGADKEQTEAAAEGIISTLTGALARNASSQEGANNLANALERDHDGSILDDVSEMLLGNKTPNSEKALDGSGILSHLLGDKQSNAVDMISRMSGLESSKTGSLMSMLAPMVMGALGKTKREQGLNTSGIFDMLTGAFSQQKQKGNNTAMGMISRFIDQDGDGSIVDEVAGMGMKLLGGFFRKR